MFSTTGGRPTQFKFGVNFVDRDARLRSRAGSASSRSSPTRTARSPINLTAATPESSSYTVGQHRHGLPVQRRDAAGRRLRRRPDDDRRLRHGRHRALGRARASLPARASSDFDQEVNTFDPFGLFVRDGHGGEQQHRLLPGRQLRVGAAAGHRTCASSYSTTVNRPEFRELAAFEFTDVVGNRAVQGQPGPEARADPERRRAAGRLFSGGRGVLAAQRLLQVLRQADRARRHRRRPAARRRSRTPTAPATSASSSRPAGSSASTSSSTRTTRSSTRQITLLAGAARRCRPRWSGRSPVSRRTCST